MDEQSNLNPHDVFFKSNFEDKEIVISYIETFLPENISRHIDKESLVLEKTEYSDKNMKKYFSDIVYNCNFKDTGIKLTLLFEHKSYQDDYIHFQLLRYMLNIWKREIKDNKKPSPILPIIFFNGATSFHVKTFYEYFEKLPDELKPYIPTFDYLLTDLTKCSDEFISIAIQSTKLKIVSLVMKHIRESEYFKHHFREMLLMIKEKYPEISLDFLELLFNYILYESEANSDVISDNVDVLLKIGGENFMTLAQKLRDEGEQKGFEKLKQSAIKMLEDGVDIRFISKYTDLSISEIEKLKEDVD